MGTGYGAPSHAYQRSLASPAPTASAAPAPEASTLPLGASAPKTSAALPTRRALALLLTTLARFKVALQPLGDVITGGTALRPTLLALRPAPAPCPTGLLQRRWLSGLGLRPTGCLGGGGLARARTLRGRRSARRLGRRPGRRLRGFPPAAGVFLPAAVPTPFIDIPVIAHVYIPRSSAGCGRAAPARPRTDRGAALRGLRTCHGALGGGAIATPRPFVALLHIATTARPIRRRIPCLRPGRPGGRV